MIVVCITERKPRIPNSIDAQFIDTIIDAKLTARSFPGLSVKPSQEDAETWDVTHSIDDRFDRTGVPLDELRVQVENALMELQAVYGEHGEKLLDMPLHIELVDATQDE